MPQNLFYTAGNCTFPWTAGHSEGLWEEEKKKRKKQDIWRLKRPRLYNQPPSPQVCFSMVTGVFSHPRPPLLAGLSRLARNSSWQTQQLIAGRAFSCHRGGGESHRVCWLVIRTQTRSESWGLKTELYIATANQTMHSFIGILFKESPSPNHTEDMKSNAI